MEIGERWNGWTIKEKIGEGSYGKVYRIVRDEFGHVFESALKVIRIPQNQSEVKSVMSEGMTQQDATDYYQGMVHDLVDEIALMDDLKGNINIVRYEDHMLVPIEDEFGWNIYIRMELLTPLVDHMGNEHIQSSEVIKLGIDICNALEECHSYRIIHRDIKPENVFYSKKQDCYKLGDFGIARRFEKTSGMSKKGTYSYMAPEVYKGLDYNETVDEYSLGILLYQLLNNNRLPFMPDYPEKIHFEDKENANFKRLSGQTMKPPCNAGVGLSSIILRACSYDPKKRYRNIAEMRSDLTALLESGDIGSKVSGIKPERSTDSDKKDEGEKGDISPEEVPFDNDHEKTVVMFESDIKKPEPVRHKVQKSTESDAKHQTHPKELKSIKEDAKKVLRYYKNPADYSGKQRYELVNIIDKGCVAIDDAEDNEEVEATLKEFKKVIDKIKSNAQLNEELKSEKTSAICELDENNRNDVSEEEKRRIKAVIQQSIRDINNAKTVEEIERIKESALKEIKSCGESKKHGSIPLLIAFIAMVFILIQVPIIPPDESYDTDETNVSHGIYDNYSSLREVWKSDDKDTLVADIDKNYTGLSKNVKIKGNTVKIKFYPGEWFHNDDDEEVTSEEFASDMSDLAVYLGDTTGYEVTIKVAFYDEYGEKDHTKKYHST